MASKSEETLKRAVKELADKFEFLVEGEVDKYLGVKIRRRKNCSIKMYQLSITTQIIETSEYNNRTDVKKTPALPVKYYIENSREKSCIWIGNMQEL